MHMMISELLFKLLYTDMISAGFMDRDLIDHMLII